MWDLVTCLPRVVEVSLWTKQGLDMVQILLDLKSQLFLERLKEGRYRSAGIVGRWPFKIGPVDMEPKSFALEFDEPEAPRTVVFKEMFVEQK